MHCSTTVLPAHITYVRVAIDLPPILPPGRTRRGHPHRPASRPALHPARVQCSLPNRSVHRVTGDVGQRITYIQPEFVIHCQLAAVALLESITGLPPHLCGVPARTWEFPTSAVVLLSASDHSPSPCCQYILSAGLTKTEIISNLPSVEIDDGE